MIGIIQEQHPERARLFMQWKRMDWPIMVDPLNLLEVQLVPITLAIDEHGVIRMANLKLSQAKEIESIFLNQSYPQPDDVATPKTTAPNLNQLQASTSNGTAEAWRNYADALVMWGGSQRLGEAIAAYEKALQIEPARMPDSTFSDEYSRFRPGVAYRMRYDSEACQANDFQLAIENWERALDLNPNNYIIRRRIQQYGPRLTKPYSFYDWVIEAEKEIQKRGEAPVALKVQPGGAEFARPNRSFETAEAPKEEPDPRGRIHRDDRKFIHIETTVAPSTIAAETAARIHLVFRPNQNIKAHWNNEVGNLEFWINPAKGWEVDSRFHAVPNPQKAVSREIRTIELEVKSPQDIQAGPARFSGYALYYVCEDVNGVCLYRRQDVEFQINVR
jgi:tetratricopeptide (TPR) repeat protein